MRPAPYALITRPIEQANALQQLLQQHGVASDCFPSLIIEPLNPSVTSQLAMLIDMDIIIFISRHAVIHSQPSWPTFTEKQQIFAVGNSTKSALVAAGITQVKTPVHADSEHLLSMPELRQVKGKKVAIISGENGRALLEQSLSKQGAVVEKIAVYQRKKPASPRLATTNHWQQTINLIITTSNEGLTNFYQLLPQHAQPWAKNCTLLVVSQRGAMLARELGFHQLIIANDASNQAIWHAIRTWYNL